MALGTMLPPGPVNLPELLVRFHASHPGIGVHVREGSAPEILALLRRDEVDGALRAAGAIPRIVYESDELLSMRELVAGSLGVSVVPRSTVDGDGPRVARPASDRLRSGVRSRSSGASADSLPPPARS